MYYRCIRCILFLFIPVFFIFLTHKYFTSSSKILDCPDEHFHINGLTECHPWLTCMDLHSIKIIELIAVGAVKAVYRAEWNNLSVAYSQLNNPAYLNDFKHGLEMLKKLNPSPYVVQLIGYCESKYVILTEYHKFGSADNITHIIHSSNKDDNTITRLKLCLNYALLLDFLHNGPAGCRVMCDSNSLEKLLSQILVTDDLSLKLNDLDATPEVDKLNKSIKCGHKRLEGDFLAPEQRWNLSTSFEDKKMPGYDEKTDIWKAASVCDHFLGELPGSEWARYRLFYLHKNCKDHNPIKRPSAVQLAAQYIKVLHEIQEEDEM